MPAPTFAQELLVARLREQWAFDMIRIQPNFATVLRSAGTGVIVVRQDGARADAEQIIPVTAGVRWEAGQRIVTVPTPGGTPVAIGVVPTSAAGYAVVGTEHIIPASITAALVANGAVSFSKLDVDTQSKITTAATSAATALTTAQTAATSATNANNRAASLEGRTLSLENRMGSVETTAGNAAYSASQAHTRLDNLSLNPGVNSVGAAQIVDRSIGSDEMADNAVVSRMITAGHVTKSKLSLNIRQTINQLCNANTGACSSWQSDTT